MKKFLKVFTLVFACILLVGCGEDNSSNEVKYTSNGLTITMESGLLEKTNENFDVYFQGSKMIFMAVEEKFDTLEIVNLDSNSTLDDYITLILANNGESSGKLQDGDLTYFTYEREVNGQEFFYVGTAYKTDEAFWLINFACQEKDKDEYKDLFIKYAKTIRFE